LTGILEVLTGKLEVFTGKLEILLEYWKFWLEYWKFYWNIGSKNWANGKRKKHLQKSASKTQSPSSNSPTKFLTFSFAFYTKKIYVLKGLCAALQHLLPLFLCLLVNSYFFPSYSSPHYISMVLNHLKNNFSSVEIC
jgi:hypothetical protein